MKTVQERTIDAGIAAAALETVDFEIEASAQAFRTLIDGLYTDKVLAVIREISTNAYDAQVEAGNGDLPFEVHLPTPLEPHFSVRDFGTSMTHAKVMAHYTRLFRSDRGHTNDAVGQYGLGSKSPYSISDSFVVTAYLDGEARVYVASLNEVGKPIFSHVSTLPSDEPNGLLVSVTPSETNRIEFLAKARQVYQAFPVAPTTNVPLELEAPLASGDGWALYAAKGSDKILIRQGTVAYPSGLASPLNYGYELVVDVPIGTVSVTPSREALQRDATTVAALRTAVDPVLEAFRQTLIDQVLSAPTYRCCRYEVIAEITDPTAHQETFTAVEDVKAPKKAKKAKAPRGKVTIKSSVAGELDKARFDALVAQHGSQSKLAKALGVSQGTVTAWKSTLNGGGK